jgi:hypothetical protein
MAAALVRGRAETDQEGALMPILLARDLYQIAELVDLCFGSRMDSGGGRDEDHGAVRAAPLASPTAG